MKYKWLGILLLTLSVLAVGQRTVVEKDSQAIVTSGTSLLFQDTIGSQTNQFEMVVTGSPATVTVTVVGCMRSNTCSAALATSSSTTNVLIPVTGGPYDYYKITGSWTGGGTVTLTFNRTGSSARSNNGGAASSVAFSGITSGTNTQAAMQVGGLASLFPTTPAQSGQIIGTQTWLQPGLSVPVAVSSNTGGSLLSGHATYIVYTLNSALGETTPSIELFGNNIGSFGAGCASGNACSITVTAPTIPAGYTGYTVYSRDCGTIGTCVGPELRQTASSACINITINCVIQIGGAGANYPTTNTAVVSPPNVQATNGALGFIPSVFFPKTDGNYYPWLGVEWNSCDAVNGPPTPCGTPMFTHRTWFNDNPANTPVGGKNAFVLIDHLSGTGTVLTNQDRALWVNHQNLATDVSQHYSITGIQAEVDVKGAPTWQAAVDAEVATGSYQLEDDTTNGPGSPNGGAAVVRGGFFSKQTGNGLTNVAGFRSNMAAGRPSGTYQAGTLFKAFEANWLNNGAVSVANLQGVGYQINFPTTAQKFGSLNIGINVGGGPMTVGTTDYLLNNAITGLPSNFAGPVVVSEITNSAPSAALTVNAALNAQASVTVTQGTMPTPASVGCAGGASQYTYALVGLDNNGGQVASTGINSASSCVNPLTGPNPATVNITNNQTVGRQYAGFVRIDVYRTGGPMALGKIGSLTCAAANQNIGPTCNAFSDTGLAVSGTVPTVNTTGTSVAYLFGTSTNCAAVGSAASPSVAACGAASAGSFSCATNAVTTCTVNTTAVTANSQIFISQREDVTTGTRLGVTCNVTPSTVNPNAITVVVAGTSFTFGLTQPVTNPDCFSYLIINQ